MNNLDVDKLNRVAADCPGFQARATARAVTRFYNDCFKPFGLTAEQFSLLVGIGAADGASVVDLADSAGVDATTLSRNVQHLEKRGLVLVKGGRGRAGKQLRLSQDGQQLLSEALPIWVSAKADLSQRLGAEKLQITKEAMADLAEAARTARA